MGETINNDSTSVNRYIPLMSIFYAMIRAGSKTVSDSVFASLRIVLNNLRKIHVRYAMMASSDAVLLADSYKCKEQESELLKEVDM